MSPSDADQSIRKRITVQTPDAAIIEAHQKQRRNEAMFSLVMVLVAIVIAGVGATLVAGVGWGLLVSGIMVFIVGVLTGRNT